MEKPPSNLLGVKNHGWSLKPLNNPLHMRKKYIILPN